MISRMFKAGLKVRSYSFLWMPKVQFCDIRHKSIAELLEIRHKKRNVDDFQTESNDILYYAMKNNKSVFCGVLSFIFFYNSLSFGGYFLLGLSVYNFAVVNSNLSRILSQAEVKYTKDKNDQVNLAIE